MRYWIFLLFFLPLISGCADLKKSEQLERMEALEAQLNAWDDTFEEFDSTQLQKREETSISLTARLKQLEADTIDLEDARKLNTFKYLREKLPSAITQKKKCEVEIQRALNRILLLRKDIESGAGERHKYDHYIDEEAAYVKQQEEQFERCKEDLEDIQKNWQSSVEEMTHLLDEYNHKEEVQ